ncbi:MAG: hypothetical protein JW937_07455 [Candidatus Omnitrophica bacterium]|nr:hypothetical protein [Candidatus Omnitrophota bacterium]
MVLDRFVRASSFILTVCLLFSPPLFAQTEQRDPSEPVGEIFGEPVPLGNYYFAKRVHYHFPRPGEQSQDPEKLEETVWENLILHFEATQRGLPITDQEFEERINKVLKDQNQSFTRKDTEQYAAWVKETLGYDVALFENQMQYMLLVDKLKDEIRNSMQVTVSEEEMHQEFIDQRHHVGGEYVLFDTREEAEEFYQKYKKEADWEKAKTKDEEFCKNFSMITLQAIMDLWSVPRETIFAFHALDEGSVGPPMPFGTAKWGVFRLMEKRTGDLNDFPPKREEYFQRIERRKKYQALDEWVKNLKEQSKLKVFINPDTGENDS